jgi:hypothetical protein
VQELGYQTEKGQSVEGDYITERAKWAPAENYAECFRLGVMNGPDNPCAYSEESQVYKVCKVAYDDLVAFAGYGSRATKRMAAYLGINIPEEP